MPAFRPPVAQAPLYLPGVAGSYLSTPDAADLDLTGDVDIAIEAALDAWAPGGGINQTLCGKYGASPNRSYRLVITPTGLVRFEYTTGGGFDTAVTRDSTAKVSDLFGDGERCVIRAMFDADNGASGNTVKFYAGSRWDNLSQLGADVTNSGAATIHSAAAAFEVGASAAGTTNFAAGRYYRVVVRNGLNGAAFIDLDLKNPPAEWVRDGTVRHDGTRVWTLNGTRWAWRA